MRFSNIVASFTVNLLELIQRSKYSSSKPSYVSPVETPNMETLAEDYPQVIDFVMLYNDIVEEYADENLYPYVANMDITGSTKKLRINIDIEVVEGTNDIAVQVFMSDLLRKISTFTAQQDGRFTRETDESFGSFFDMYQLRYTITRGEETVEKKTIKPGGEIPFDPGLYLE